MVRYWVHEKELFEVAKACQTIFDTYKKASSDKDLSEKLDPTGEKLIDAFRSFVTYLLICPYTNE